MEFRPFDDNENLSLLKFESMLKTNNILFFDANEFENIINHYLDIGKIALAKKAIKLGLNQHPNATNLKLFQVEIYVFENQLDLAEALLNKLHYIEPSNEEIYIQKANIYSKKDEHEKAILALKTALQLADDATDILSLMGMEYLFLDKLEEAKQCFLKCLKTDPNDYSALHNIIYCFEFLEQTNAAITFLNEYLNTSPYCEVAWHQLGKQYFTKKQYKKAIVAFDFAIISDDTFIGAYIEKAKVLEKQKQYAEAIEHYKITLALDDPTAFALLRIGHCYKKLNQNHKALHYFFKTVEEDPLLDKAWIAITKFYNAEKNYKKALLNINKAISIDNQNIAYWKLYAQINQRLHRLDAAEKGYKTALDLGDYELNTWLNRTDVLIQLEAFNSAIQNLNQASEFHPNNEEIEFRLAGLFFTNRDLDQGKLHLENALQQNSEYEFIIETLFPRLYQQEIIQKIIQKYKKVSN